MGRWIAGAALTLALGMSPVHVSAAPPAALPSIKAHKSLLLDVARAGKRLVAVGERGHIVLSDDEGKSWRQASVPVRSLLTTVFFVDDRHGWVVGHESAILSTSDAGQTWIVQHYKEFDPNVAPPPADDAAMDEDFGDDAFVEEEEDAGRNIGSREGVPLLDVWFADTQRGIAVGAYGLMLRTVDGGKTWQDASDSVSNAEGWHFNAIAGIPGQGVLIAGEKGTLYRSVDNGQTFSPMASPYAGSWFGAMVTRSGDFYVFGLQGSLFRSSDNGVSWARLETGVSSGLNDGCEAVDGSVEIAGNAGVVLSRAASADAFTTFRRSDRQTVLSCVIVGEGQVLVGEGGAKLADLRGENR